MAEKKPMIVIKKITVVAGGAHGGAWKVAFADFMTAMMAFFLVMWLVAQSSEQTKKAVSDYFSTPSVIEYNFSNYGVELTLEKLFLDLVNEPLKTLQTFMDPMDKTPNVMGMGMKKIVMAYMADQLGDIAQNVEVGTDSASFDIPDTVLFERGKATPAGQFTDIMEKIKGVTAGLEDSDLMITSFIYIQAVEGSDPQVARNIAGERLSLISKKLESTLEHETVTIKGRVAARTDDRSGERKSSGFIRIEVKQKEVLSNGRKPRKIEGESMGSKTKDGSVYDNFVKGLSTSKKSHPSK